ncbi:hypothetical protein BWQ96_03582 [Gracilariopsis chorda]|nr:hypothetical protein BWQ96_03582 [Gracilariopsis chorda]|eukprot:PXF46593.1 hypothetical protein BWQ96_03582 [Gracilariopsis chorda]
MQICDPPDDEVWAADSEGGRGKWVMMDIETWGAGEVLGVQYNGEARLSEGMHCVELEYLDDLDLCIRKLAALDLAGGDSDNGELWSPHRDYEDPVYWATLRFVTERLEALSLS